MKRRVARRASTLLAAMALGLVAVLGTTATPASAASATCPKAYHCYWRYSGQTGTSTHFWKMSGQSDNLTSWGIHTRSSHNNGTSGKRHCGFGATGRRNLQTSNAQNARKSYGLRTIRSNTWTTKTCSAAEVR